MQVFSRRNGAGIAVLGAALVLCGAFLPTYGSGDYEPAALRNAPLFLVALLVVPALLVLVSGVLAWFRLLPIWLTVLDLVIVLLAFVLHLFGSLLSTAFSCFDVCPPGGVHLGTGFWLPLVGLALSAIGLAVAAIAQGRRASPAPPAALP